MEMNWGLESSAHQFKLATCHFPNPYDLRVTTVSSDVLMHRELCLIDKPRFWSYFITALIVMQMTCKRSGSLLRCHLHKHAGKNFFFAFFHLDRH